MTTDKCPKCFKDTLQVRGINTGSLKSEECIIDCTPLVEVTCFGCGWCNYIPFSHIRLKVMDITIKEDWQIESDHQWEVLTPFGFLPAGG